MKKQKYTVDYFIDKFSNIYESCWCTFAYTDPYLSHCALGHCGASESNPRTPESSALIALFDKVNLSVASVNDNDNRDDELAYDCFGSTAKERILTVLTNIKYMYPSL